MKKAILSTILLSSFVSASTVIQLNESFEGKISSEFIHYKSSFEVQSNDKDMKVLQKRFKKIFEQVKSYDICKSGGALSIYPRYNYKKNNKFMDYSANMKFSDCSMKDLSKYDKMINKINTKDILLNIFPLTTSIETPIIKAKTEELRQKAIKYAQDFVKNKKEYKCRIEQIRFDNSFNNMPRNNYVMYKSESSTKSFLPIKNDFKVSIVTNYTFTCSGIN